VRLAEFVGNAVLALVMVGVLRPLSTVLPYARALGVARCFGFVAALLPWYGHARVAQVSHAFRESPPAGGFMRLAAERLSRPLCDSVVLRRALRGRADRMQWGVRERTVAEVDALRASDESFILATGHFARQAFLALYSPQVLPQHTTTLLLPRTVRTLHPRTWWHAYHYGQMLDGMRELRPDLEVAHPGNCGTYWRLVERLHEPRNTVVVYVDAPRGSSSVGSYVRPFAGLERRQFATGAARLSRMSQRPIAVCIPYLVGDESVVLDWTRVIRPAATRDAEADKRVTDTILDDFEIAIGRRPAQYLLECFGKRRWDARTERWVAPS
jgi:lauroyl/myristoyl acyltransferase